jgi:hypothetical protein
MAKSSLTVSASRFGRSAVAVSRLTDGRVLPGTFNTFTHGYAVTSHSSQSKTVDDVLLVASSRSFGAVNREQFYVSISRGRKRVHVFTDDAELLARRVTDSHERKAAVELQGLRDDLAKLGFLRQPQQEQDISVPRRRCTKIFARCARCVSRRECSAPRVYLRCNGSHRWPKMCSDGFANGPSLSKRKLSRPSLSKPSPSNKLSP